MGVVLLVLVILHGCSDEQRATVAGGPPAARASASIDFTAIMERARLSFRADPSGLRGETASFAVLVTDGSLRFIPRDSSAMGTPTSASQPELALKTVAIRRGSNDEPMADGQAVISHDGSALIHRGMARERIGNTLDGVEQSWHFAAKPSGSGDLVVELDVTGLPYWTTTEGGLHFGVPDGGAMVRYGHGTWIDAAGRRTPLPARFENGRITLRVPHVVVEGASYPAVLDPIISPEFAVDQPVPGVITTGTPSIARVGNTYLAAWSDSRYGGSCFATRIDATTGAILDPLGIGVGLKSPFSSVAVASNGTEFIVVYSAPGPNSTVNHLARRISASDGSLIDSPILLGEQGVGGRSLLYAGGYYYMTWSASQMLYGARLHGATGQLLDGSPTNPGVPLLSASNTRAMASDGSTVLVASGGKAVRVQLATGTVLDSSPITVTGLSAQGPVSWGDGVDVAFDGTNYFVAWGGTTLKAARITPQGTNLDPPDEFNQLPGGLVLCASGAAKTSPRLRFDGTRRLLSWTQSGTRISGVNTANGTLLDATGGACGLFLSSGTGLPYLYGSTLLLTSGNLGHIFDADTFAPAGILQLTTAVNGQGEPVVATNGADFLVVWQDLRHSTLLGVERDLYAARVRGSDGVVLDASPIAISTAAGAQENAAVASNGTDYLVVWESATSTARRIRGTRVRSSDGAVLDGAPSSDGMLVDQTTGQTPTLRDVSVASDGVNYFVAYVQVSGSTNYVYGLRMNAAGVVIDSGSSNPSKLIGLFTSWSSSAANATPVVAADAVSDPALRTFLVAWRQRASSNGPWTVRTARVRAALGVLLDNSGKELTQASNSPSELALASDGKDFLLAWSGVGPGSAPLHGVRIDAFAGTSLDGQALPIATANALHTSPTVTFSGLRYYALWKHAGSPPLSVKATRLDPTGQVLDGPANYSGFTVADDTWVNRVRAAANAQGRVLAVYDKFDTTLHGWRVKGRFLEDTPEEIEGGVVWEGSVPEAGDDAALPDAGGLDGSADVGVDVAPGLPDAAPDGATPEASVDGAVAVDGAVDGAVVVDASGGDSASEPPPRGPSDEGGCGCRTDARHRQTPGSVVLLGLLLASWARRRHRRWRGASTRAELA